MTFCWAQSLNATLSYRFPQTFLTGHETTGHYTLILYNRVHTSAPHNVKCEHPQFWLVVIKITVGYYTALWQVMPNSSLSLSIMYSCAFFSMLCILPLSLFCTLKLNLQNWRSKSRCNFLKKVFLLRICTLGLLSTMAYQFYQACHTYLMMAYRLKCQM